MRRSIRSLVAATILVAIALTLSFVVVIGHECPEFGRPGPVDCTAYPGVGLTLWTDTVIAISFLLVFSLGFFVQAWREWQEEKVVRDLGPMAQIL